MSRIKRIISFTVIVLIVMTAAFCVPTGVLADDNTAKWPTGPDIQGDGAIVIEADTGTILYEKNSHDKFYPASTTKILTTLVALENSELDEIVEVSYAADHYVSATSSRMGLKEGEQLTMEQALYGIMLESANEATYAVGEHVGGSIARFIKMMNSKAQALGCTNSHFANSHGLHDEDHYTCPYDLMLISRAAYQNDTFMKISGTTTYAMPETNKNDAKILTNHHWFLNGTMKYEYCIGGKTGATTQAGYALVTYAKKEGVNLICVVMHAPTWNAVYVDSKTLLDFCYDNYDVYDLNETGDAASDFPSMFDLGIDRFSESLSEPIKNTKGGVVILPKGVPLKDAVKTISYDDNVEIGYGDNLIGRITYTYGGQVVGGTDIIYNCSEDVMTKARLEKEWPSFMIPIDVAFEGVETGRLAVNNREETGTGLFRGLIDTDAMRPYIVAIIVGGVVLLGGIAVLAVVKRR